MAEAQGPWSTIVDPIAARYEVAAFIGGTTVYNAEGSAAMAKILRRMALIIDTEIKIRTTPQERALAAIADGEDSARG